MTLRQEKILSTVGDEDFIGRTGELDALVSHARGKSRFPGLLMLTPPGMGGSEILRQAFDRLFAEQADVIPFYFAFRRSDKTVGQMTTRFLHSFLQQTVAFRRRDRKLLDSPADFRELVKLSPPSDGLWIERLADDCRAPGDLRSIVRSCLGAPLHSLAGGGRVFAMIDDLHEAEHLSGEIDLFEELCDVFFRSGSPFVFAGRRRALLEGQRGDFEILEIEPLSFADSGTLAENLAEKHAVKLSQQTRDLLAVQLGGSPLFIKLLFRAADEKKISLNSFQQLERLYAGEIFGGRLARYYDSLFADIVPGLEAQKLILGLLHDTLVFETEKTHLEAWQQRAGLDEAVFQRVIRLLDSNEIIRLTSNMIEPAGENLVLGDYVKARFQLEVAARSRAQTVGEAISDFMKRAPRLLANFYRGKSAIGLRELLSVFNCQEVPLALLDYGRFKDDLKGEPDEEILTSLGNSADTFMLPQIVYTAHTVAFYAPFGKAVEKERSAVALGFIECSYTEEDETVWIAAEIDSKLEAPRELAESWCERLETVARACNFRNHKIWLVAPEGFSPEAVEVLQARSGFGSSRKQVELLIDWLGAGEAINQKTKSNEYEMIVPMGEDTELIAAQTVEEIARRHNFAPKAINQIKTALVEACINAAEHSHSPDNKIYQKFAVEDDRIVITISNRGLRLSDKKAREITPNEGRRGWGLKLMKSLMDEVKFEQVDDGTRISMTKYLRS